MAVRVRISVAVPKEIFNSKRAVQNIVGAMRTKTAPRLKELFGKTVDGWNNPPGFWQRQYVGAHTISMTVYAGGANAEKYGWVNNGVPYGHIIVPRRARMLRFRTGYRAGTRPRVLSSRAYSRFGDYISTPIVSNWHIEARNFDETVAEKHYPEFVKDMQDAFRK